MGMVVLRKSSDWSFEGLLASNQGPPRKCVVKAEILEDLVRGWLVGAGVCGFGELLT